MIKKASFCVVILDGKYNMWMIQVYDQYNQFTSEPLTLYYLYMNLWSIFCSCMCLMAWTIWANMIRISFSSSGLSLCDKYWANVLQKQWHILWFPVCFRKHVSDWTILNSFPQRRYVKPKICSIHFNHY